MENAEIGKKLATGTAFRAIVNNQEWPVISDIFKKEYMAALSTLIDHEDQVARATITAIDILYARITNGIKMADVASFELAKKIK